jgi:hypothetical protein
VAADVSAPPDVLRLVGMGEAPLAGLLDRFGLRLRLVPDGAPLPGSHWGAPEAGLEGNHLYARRDTPIHSVLHESAHYVCMDATRRSGLSGDAGGDDLEECAVCYLQVLLAAHLPAPMGHERMFQDMDLWGYSFRQGSAAVWFTGDGHEARGWLARHGIIDARGNVTFRLRGERRDPG